MKRANYSKALKISLSVLALAGVMSLSIEQVRADDTNTSNVPESTNNAERLIMPQEEQQEKDFSTQIPKLEQNTNKIQQSQQNINEQSQEQQYDDNQFKGLAPD